MISFNLKCENDHQFESWFKSNDAFEKLAKSGMVHCMDCGSTNITKMLMAPSVVAGRNKATAPVAISKPNNDVEKALTKIREDVEKNSEYVGMDFASEARAIHDGDQPERSIYGEAKPEDAKALIEDGVAVTPLPFVPKRNTN